MCTFFEVFVSKEELLKRDEFDGKQNSPVHCLGTSRREYSWSVLGYWTEEEGTKIAAKAAAVDVVFRGVS